VRKIDVLVLLFAFGIAGVLVTSAYAQAEAEAQLEPDLARGEELFELCAQCHGSTGSGNQAFEAPAIAGLPAWYVEAQVRNFRGGVRGAHPDDYAGLRMRPMARMLPQDQKLVDVTHYVASLDPVMPEATLTGDAARGKLHYDQVCVTCHAADGSGNEALHAPPLLYNSDWYMVAQLQKFKSGIRGAKPGDTWGATMRSMSMTLEDEQHMRDVVAYVLTLRK
jgi:cytochrome c553